FRKRVKKMYNYIVNDKTGSRFPCSDFYVYPLTANDYAEVYRNYEKDKYPAMAFIYLTNKCTDNCVGCFAKAIEDGNEYLEKEDIFNLLQDLSDHGTKAIKLAGREPSASPYLSDCLFKAKELGLKSLVITSGANIDKHVDALSDAVTHLRVSLNTISQELHDKIHRPTDEALRYDERVSYLKKIIERRKKNALITGATYLVRTSNDPNALEYVKICKELGFDYVRFTVLDEKKGEWSNEWDNIYNKILRYETPFFRIITHKPIPKCDIKIMNENLIDPAIVSRVVIHANGKVNSCHEGWRGKWCKPGMATFGNIKQQKFNDIWTGNQRKEFLDHIIDTHVNNNGINNVCDKNCKYDGFNIVQKWIISELEKDPDATFSEINVAEEWR
ncbi:MAG: radical SAM protein, partial [Lachnospiraceae bacterium]|nr:radical SAM protein [Lachnospiraceae bacterium]